MGSKPDESEVTKIKENMTTVFAAYYKPMYGSKKLVKFFESRQDAEEYLISDSYYGYKSKDKFDLNFRLKRLKEKFEIEERSLVDILNELYSRIENIDNRLDYHSM